MSEKIGIEDLQFDPPDIKQDPIYIQNRQGEEPRMVDELQNALLEDNAPIYKRAGQLVTLIYQDYNADDGRKTRVSAIHPMNMGKLRYMTHKGRTQFLRYNERSKKLLPCDVPEKIMTTMLDIGHWKFGNLAGVINAPTMRPDGTIISKRGYDEATEMWVNWNDYLVMPRIADHPTREDAIKAKNILLHLISGFAFETDLDRSVALSSILTAVLRAAFEIAPMFLIHAHVPGTGKSYFADVVSTIINGRPCPVINIGKNEEEIQKRLGALLLEGPSIVSLDNLTTDLDGELLCSMCSQRMVKVRILGQSVTPECEWRGTLFATGNNIGLVNDMTRRGLVMNMDAVVERPELRSFAFEPVDEILKDRGKYIAAALTIVKAFLVSGETAHCSAIGGYQEWSRFARQPLVWLGMDDPVQSMEQSRAADPGRNMGGELLQLLKAIFPVDTIFEANDIVKASQERKQAEFDNADTWEWVWPELRNFLLDEAGDYKRSFVEVRKLGKLLTRINGDIHGDLRIIKLTRGTKRLYQLQKVDKT